MKFKKNQRIQVKITKLNYKGIEKNSIKIIKNK